MRRPIMIVNLQRGTSFINTTVEFLLKSMVTSFPIGLSYKPYHGLIYLKNSFQIGQLDLNGDHTLSLTMCGSVAVAQLVDKLLPTP